MDGSIHPQRVLVDCRDGHDLVSLRVPVPVHLGPGEEAEGTQTSHTRRCTRTRMGACRPRSSITWRSALTGRYVGRCGVKDSMGDD